SIVGGCTLSKMSALSKTSASSRAPFAAYPSSKKPANSPAPDCTATSKPASVSLGTSSGTSATRCSPGTVSFGTLTIMGIDTVRILLARYSNPVHESCYLLMRKEVRGFLHAFCPCAVRARLSCWAFWSGSSVITSRVRSLSMLPFRGNLGSEATHEELRRLFEAYGQVVQVH